MAYQGFAQFPYGAVYFRKSSPQKADFERDYAQAARDGMNTFRHWFMWHAIETAPGVYDWDEWDMQLELAAKYGIKTIIAECIHAAPEWAFAEYAHARFVDADGKPSLSKLRNSSATAGFSGLCLDNTDFKALAGNFLTVLAKRYKGHPGLGGYDVMNETNQFSSGFGRCFCPASQADFRLWLQKKYGDLKTLAEAWRRYSLTDWSQVQIPRGYEIYPEYFDYADYHVENSINTFAWRVETLRAVDPDAAMVAHGVHDASLHRRLEGADDDWEYAKVLDGYGYSGGGGIAPRAYGTDKRWEKMLSADVTRMGSDGKPFWACERTSGPTYSLADNRFRYEFNENHTWVEQKEVTGVSRDTRSKQTGEDVRANDFVALAGGVRGLFSNRWRGLDDGPFFGAMGYYNNDGSPNDRSEAASKNAKWANAPEQKSLWSSAPIYGDIAILNCPESQICVQLMSKSAGQYTYAVRGAYNAWMDLAAQPDIIKLEQLKHYSCAYLPFPFRLKKESVERLKAWVRNGGVLISEGCPGYLDDSGHVAGLQPAMGLDEMFGCREKDFFIDANQIRSEGMYFSFKDCPVVYGGVCEQVYEPTVGKAVGWYDNGAVAAIENQYGKGRTLLMGTSPGFGFYDHQTDEMRAFFKTLLDWAGVEQHVKSGNPSLIVRLHDGDGGPKLWIVNAYKDEAEAEIILAGKYAGLSPKRTHWGVPPEMTARGTLCVTVGRRDAVVVSLG